LAVEIIHHIERPKPPATSQRVGHEVHRPDLVRQLRYIKRNPIALGQTALGDAAQVEPHTLVNTVDPLMVPLRTGAAKALAVLPEAPAGVLLHQLRQLRDDFRIPNRPVQRWPIPRTLREAHAGTGPSHRP